MIITVDDIRAKNPCYDPTKHVPENWSGTLLDVLNLEKVSADDRIWVVTRFLDDKPNRLFAVWCVREALKVVENPDPRTIAACDVAEKFAHGETTAEALAAAWAAARAAASAAAWAAARAAARAAQLEKLKEILNETY